MSNLDPNRSIHRAFPNAAPLKYASPILAEVIFGAPGKNCDGVGICRVLPAEAVRVRWKCPSARAWLSVNQEGALCLSFERSWLLPDYCERFFSGPEFLVEESYSMPKSVLSLLNIDSFTVEPGRYSIKVSEHFFIICFLNN